MEIVNNYNDYKKFVPEYSSWRDKQDLQREKRLEYLRRNPDKINQNDVQRGKMLLHSIDVMDEYSQSNAEDMEVATELVTGQVVGLATFLGVLAGAPLSGLKFFKNLAAKISKDPKVVMLLTTSIPSMLGLVVGSLAGLPAIIWSTKAKVGASRQGRFEAMRKDLSNPVVFAELTPEQVKKAENEAKNIKIEEKDKNKTKQELLKKPLKSFKTLKNYFSKDGEYAKQKAEFNAKLKEAEKHFGETLTDSQIKQAKKDQQILSDIVRRMDIASQDYAENTELATNTLTALSLGTGGLVGWASSKLLSLLKVKGGMAAKVLPWAVGVSIPLVMSIYAAKVQKQSARIGRFKVRQEMLNNPASLVYVDDKETAAMKDVKLPERAKKPNIFKFFVQLVKDNNEYQQYRKTKAIEELKYYKALEKIDLSPEQLKAAKNLQMNVFRTFNKVDEKSQAYSESVEAVGKVAQIGASTVGYIAAAGLSIKNMLKIMEHPEKLGAQSSLVNKILKS